jgi:hypothetical protein
MEHLSLLHENREKIKTEIMEIETIKQREAIVQMGIVNLTPPLQQIDKRSKNANNI